MREYTLNDIGFTPGSIEPFPTGGGVDHATDEELQEITRRNRESFDRLWADYEERQKTELAPGLTPAK